MNITSYHMMYLPGQGRVNDTRFFFKQINKQFLLRKEHEYYIISYDVAAQAREG